MKKLVLLFAVGLSGCSSGTYVTCPTLVPYSLAEQKSLEGALKYHPEVGPLPAKWISDYIGLRDQVRVCTKKPEKLGLWQSILKAIRQPSS